ncbi:MAG: Exodeoxyribonuclease III [Parcubacteria group bacterium GW2011_GWA2_47_21]|nr:MAG: Exodeoxyribonuclease III [Parcubacteria group bacterium GW2011_GWA2_47_21]
MKIISWNVNGLRANIKKGGFDWFMKFNPDVYCIQETKAHPTQLPSEAQKPRGFFSYFDHSKFKKGYSGVAVFSKIEAEEVLCGLGVKALDQEGRFLGLRFKNFWLFNVYFPNGGGGPERLEFKLKYYSAFLKFVEKIGKTGLPIVFCGDVNTAHKEIDLARPNENKDNTGFLPIERAWIDKVIAKGFIDAFRYFYPNATGKYTYWDMKTFARDRNVGWRIDYFFVSLELLPRLRKAEIFEDILGSDHCPISLEVDI